MDSGISAFSESFKLEFDRVIIVLDIVRSRFHGGDLTDGWR